MTESGVIVELIVSSVSNVIKRRAGINQAEEPDTNTRSTSQAPGHTCPVYHQLYPSYLLLLLSTSSEQMETRCTRFESEETDSCVSSTSSQLHISPQCIVNNNSQPS